uniref:CU044_5270 family protein n=1 Tax=Nonomuraea lactucae TaxID=2249762 RepID=UPI000DE3ECAC
LPLATGLAAAAAALGVLAVGTAVIAGGDPTAPPGAARPHPTIPTTPTAPTTANRLTVVPLGTASADHVGAQLERISLVAAKSTTKVHEGQFAYTRRQGQGVIPEREQTMPGEGPMKMTPMVKREIWVQQQAFGGKGLIIDNGVPEEYDQGNDVEYRHRYQALAELPTDPDALLKAVYADPDTKEGDATTEDQRAFDTIGDLLEQEVLPPAMGAALYKAVAKIPGVTIVDRSQDAAGREGIAVAREDAGARTEWIFDRDTLKYLGERKVQIQDTQWLKKGTLLSTSAIFERAIVDQAGQRP